MCFVNHHRKAKRMHFYGYPSRSKMISFDLFRNFIVKVTDSCSFAVSAVTGNVFSAILTTFFCVSGDLVRGLDGGSDRTRDGVGLFKGLLLGYLRCSFLDRESSLLLWQSHESGIRCLLYLIDVIASLLSSRSGYAECSPKSDGCCRAGNNTQEFHGIFDTGAAAKGLARHVVERIPKMIITDNNHVEALGEKVSCSVCLQDFQPGETVRSLPQVSSHASLALHRQVAS